ncbi:MAG: hypothetical protein RLN85_19930, partial [Pseudomonadales bacterium]
DLATFQSSISQLREEVGASDFLELDWFLYLVNQDLIQFNQTDQTFTPEPGKRYWAIALGEGSRIWKECYQQGMIAIGWDELGDYSQYKTKEEFSKAISEYRDDGTTPTNDSYACYQFVHEMKPGDYVLSKKGRTELLGFGIIESDYIFAPERAEYQSIRKVRWLKEGNWELPGNPKWPVKTLTDITDYPQFMNFVLPIISRHKDEAVSVTTDKTPPYTLNIALDGIFLSEERFKDILSS